MGTGHVWLYPSDIVPTVNIQRPDDRVKDFAVAFTIILWDHSHYGSLWFYPTLVINIPPGSENISTTILTDEGGVVLITGSWSVLLVVVYAGWLNSRVHPILCVSPE